jgi:hypothetical protein
MGYWNNGILEEWDMGIQGLTLPAPSYQHSNIHDFKSCPKVGFLLTGKVGGGNVPPPVSDQCMTGMYLSKPDSL